MSRKASTKKRHKRIREELMAANGEILKGHFKKQEVKSGDAMKKVSTGGNSFESKKSKH
jgi:hypothetical protein